MSLIRSVVILFFFTSSVAAATITGLVRDPAGQPLAGAMVAVENVRSVVAAANGTFVIDVPQGTYTIVVSHPGFRNERRKVSTGADVEITLKTAISESIVVSGIRADVSTPVTKTDIALAEIEEKYYGQDLPLLLRDAPAVTTYTEAGSGGSGYSYISLRGVSPTRINYTLDGVPLSDSEDMGAYFVDFPDLARSLESVQIQRGVGTSTFGTAAFGGAVNLESIALSQTSRSEATFGGGSFGNRQMSVGWQSGSLPGGVNLYTRVSSLESSGYRENSATRQRNVFFSGAKQLTSNSQLKLTGFSGREWMQSSYYAADEPILRVNPRYNPLRPEEKDSFGYDLGQLQYISALGSGNLTASAYYQRGYGWYRLFKSGTEQLREYGLDGMLFGSVVAYSRTSGRLSTNYGLHVNHFKRDHTRDNLTSNVRDYSNYGVKSELNAFAKASWQDGPWLLYGDAQVRRAAFDYHGSMPINGISWTFFNPKAGARYSVNAQSSVYVSAGMTTREPARNDMFLGQDNPTVSHDLHAVRPERVTDLEVGWNYQSGRVQLAANAYAMEFRNEIAATGEQSEIGLSLRKNVDDSYRRGIELDAGWNATAQLRLRTVANLSRNRIRSWTQFYDVYDADGNWIDSQPVAYRNVEPLLTPSVVVSQAIDYTPSPLFSAGVTGRYVGRSFLDNTGNADFATTSFFMADANASLSLSRWIPAGNPRVTLQVNNLFDNKRLWASGYSYIWLDRAANGSETMNGTNYYYPQATRNFVVMVDLRM